MPALIEVDQDNVQEEFFERGWTDGLPVIPPTPSLVEAMLSSVDLESDDVIGSIPRRSRSVTAEQAATNAVMAGCRRSTFQSSSPRWARCLTLRSMRTPR